MDKMKLLFAIIIAAAAGSIASAQQFDTLRPKSMRGFVGEVIEGLCREMHCFQCEGLLLLLLPHSCALLSLFAEGPAKPSDDAKRSIITEKGRWLHSLCSSSSPLLELALSCATPSHSSKWLNPGLPLILLPSPVHSSFRCTLAFSPQKSNSAISFARSKVGVAHHELVS